MTVSSLVLLLFGFSSGTWLFSATFSSCTEAFELCNSGFSIVSVFGVGSVASFTELLDISVCSVDAILSSLPSHKTAMKEKKN
jgi:hypothetical protein